MKFLKFIEKKEQELFNKKGFLKSYLLFLTAIISCYFLGYFLGKLIF